VSLENGILTLAYPRVTSAMTLTTVFMNDTVEWFTNVPSCNAFKITSCKDKSCGQLTTSSDEFRLEENPTDKNTSTDTIEPNLEYEYGLSTASQLSVYLKAETQSLNAVPVNKTLLVKVQICDD
jgi:hypothetical protein